MIKNLKMQVKLGRERRQRVARSRRRGIAMLVMAVGMIFILGCAALAVDYGLLVNDKNKWQRGVDAAALAGAQELKKSFDETENTTRAREVAIAVARENGVAVTNDKVTFLGDNKKIRVESASTRSLLFARAIGFQTGTVNAFAVAGMETPTFGVPRPVPISVTYTTVETRRSIDGLFDNLGLPIAGGLLKPVNVVNPAPVVIEIPRVQDSPYGLNQFLVFDLRAGGKSAPKMAEQLINGSPTVAVGDLVTSLNASESVVDANFTPAIEDRFRRSADPQWGDTWTGFGFSSIGIKYDDIISGKSRADNPRIMNLIVNAPVLSNNGTTKHLILAFVPVYVESWINDQMTVRFLPDSLFGGANSGGLRTVSLLQ